MSNATILQGRFTSTGESILIPLRSGVNWMHTYNTTSMTSPANGDALSAYWQFGMPDNSGIFNLYISSSTAITQHYSTSGGFTYIDTSNQTPGNLSSTITAISTAAVPVATNSGTNGLVAGDIVRLIDVSGGASGLSGIDFVVGLSTLTNTTFSIDGAPQLSVAGTTGSWRVIDYDPIYYPRHRVIRGCAPIDSDTTSVGTTVPHGYTVGQQIRFNVSDAVYDDWVVMNGVQATIVSVEDETNFTVNVGTVSLGSMTLPASETLAFTPAMIVPIGENTAVANANSLNPIADATINTAEIGMLLSAGAQEPAGSDGDVIYWTAGVSFSVDNE